MLQNRRFMSQLSSDNGKSAGRKPVVIVLKAREQVAIPIECHHHRTVPEKRLQLLRGEALFDDPGREEVPKGVQTKLRLSGIVDHAGADLRRVNATLQNFVAEVDVAPAVGKNEAERLWCSKPVLP